MDAIHSQLLIAGSEILSIGYGVGLYIGPVARILRKTLVRARKIATLKSGFLITGPKTAELTAVLAHGAGAPMDSTFMNVIAGGLADAGIRVARFEFPYMRERREGGARRAPDREAILLDSWRATIAHLGGGSGLVIGGKSLGGRIASMLADESGARGLLCLGYPFHPPGKPAGPRLKHLRTLRTPGLIVQGTRDPFGNRTEVESYELSSQLHVAWIEDGDHSFKPRARSGRTEADNLADAVAAAVDFIGALRAPA